MAKRPKSVSTVAIFFALLAVYLGGMSELRLSHFRTPQQIYHLAWGLGLKVWALILLANAVGLWNLYNKARVASLWLSGYLGLCLLYVNLANAKKMAWLSSLPMEAVVPEVLGMFIALLWFVSPIYLLTRPKIVSAFQQPDPTDSK